MSIAESGKKIERLMDAAKMYYEQDGTRSEIMIRYGISRLMASKLLKEARDVGIVTIHIQTPGTEDSGQMPLMEQVGRGFGVYEGVVMQDGPDNHTTNGVVTETAVHYLKNLGEGTLRIG